MHVNTYHTPEILRLENLVWNGKDMEKNKIMHETMLLAVVQHIA